MIIQNRRAHWKSHNVKLSCWSKANFVVRSGFLRPCPAEFFKTSKVADWTAALLNLPSNQIRAKLLYSINANVASEVLVWYTHVDQVWSSIVDENPLTNMLFKRIWRLSTSFGVTHPKAQNPAVAKFIRTTTTPAPSFMKCCRTRLPVLW